MELKKILSNWKEDMINDILSLLEIESVAGEPFELMPEGKAVNDALERALEIGSRMGFQVRNLEGHAGYIEYGTGEEYVAVLGHLDIVPVGSDWTRDPHGEIIGDRIYGRGAIDDKGPMIAALYALKAIKEESPVLSKRIRLIFGTSEETGGPDIKNYLMTEAQPAAGFTPDADFPAINAEMGILILKLTSELPDRNIMIRGGSAVNMVPDRARAVINLDDGTEAVFEERGISAHGSTPHKGESAVWKLVGQLREAMLSGELREAKLSESFKETMEFIDDYLCRDTGGSTLGIDLSDEPSGKLVMNMGTLSLKDGMLEIGLNIRYPVTFDGKDVLLKLEETLNQNGFRMVVEHEDKPLYYPVDHELVSRLMDAYRETTGDQRGPLAIGGGTYAKEMKNIVAFGPMLPGREDIAHQADEYISVTDLLLCAEVYAKAMKALAE
ncbi:Sapep family Mn(2+)-dependent dipeptidase [Youngiibacter fragilis]|uniref:Diguanylate cyclase n=1 Tax=Youngiibacter fragilis 232.1 TaxID=994573 RepID=V7I1D4_9CLOT|nr:Sapep family Mn(2+)-dependent dipeptidase [Youngiibacter fragilis]ETA79663.1 diguanylate cyclase [Youngiibacter fragilis 232.1]